MIFSVQINALEQRKSTVQTIRTNCISIRSSYLNEQSAYDNLAAEINDVVKVERDDQIRFCLSHLTDSLIRNLDDAVYACDVLLKQINDEINYYNNQERLYQIRAAQSATQTSTAPSAASSSTQKSTSSSGSSSSYVSSKPKTGNANSVSGLRGLKRG